jgi:hypothetical protein
MRKIKVAHLYHVLDNLEEAIAAQRAWPVLGVPGYGIKLVLTGMSGEEAP